MSKVTSISSLLAVTCGVWAAVVVTSPQGRLLTRVMNGQFKAPPVRVQNFSAAEPDADAIPLQLGALHFRVPRAALSSIESSPGQNASAMAFQWDGLGLLVNRPLVNGLIPYAAELGLIANLPEGDEVSMEAAAYAADPRDVSLWMSRSQAARLDALLSLRAFLVGAIERVEVVRGEEIKGLLLVRDIGNDHCSMIFNYYAVDDRLSGTAVLILDPGNALAVKTAQKILSSFRIVAAG